MITWYRETARTDEEPQCFDATAGDLFLRVIEQDAADGSLEYAWGVAAIAHPFADKLAEECIKRGARRTEASAKSACRAAAERIHVEQMTGVSL